MAYPMYQQPMYPQLYQQMLPQQMQMQSQQQTPQIQNGGFISIPNENMVYSYPVAPGNCVTFKIEGQPIVMEKSMGFSQLESPRIERYRLVKEDVVEPVQEDEPEREVITFAEQSEVDAIRDEIKGLRADVNKLMSVKRVKKEVIIEDDTE